MNQEILSIEKSIRERNSSDKPLVNFWLYFLLLSWITLGIRGLILFFQKIGRIDKFINRKKSYYSGIISFAYVAAKEKGKADELSEELGDLSKLYQDDFLNNNKEIKAGLSFILCIVTLGIWSFVLLYKMNKVWDSLQNFEQKFYDKLNPIFSKLVITKHPININLDLSKKRSFGKYLLLSIVTLGIWKIVWDYKIHTDPDNLYYEFHSAEDSLLGAIKAY